VSPGGLILTGITLAWLGSCGGDTASRNLQKAAREYRAGNLVRARTLLEQLRNAEPGSAQADAALNFLGVIAWQMGRAQEAYEYFDRCLKRNPEYAPAAYNQAVILFRSGDLGAAQELFARAASLLPDDPRPLEYLAAIESRRRNYDSARTLLEKALELKPDSARIQTALGVLAVRTQKIPEAEAFFQEALQAQRDYAPALYNLGALYQDYLHRPSAAEKYLLRYLKVAPGGRCVSAARKRLDRIA